MDAISFLPHEVLGDILSLLPTKLAASTSLLSRKWRNVFALVHNLDFDDTVLLQPEVGKLESVETHECFKNFVNRTLALQRSSQIKNFTLNCNMKKESEMAIVGRWICNAVERGVLELDLCLHTHCHLFFLPSEFVKSKTLVKLTLGARLDIGPLPKDVSLPVLKSLSIDTIFFEDKDLCDVLLSGCSVLEELFVFHTDFEGIPYYISCKSIKKLSVHYDCEAEINCMGGMSFVAPSLVSLDYSDYALAVYREVNLESLVEAKMYLSYSKMVERPDMSGLMNGISNVETLHLSPSSADVISRCVKHGLILPMYNNLVSLSFGSSNKRSWKLLPYLLDLSPKLETLIIEGLDSYISNVTMPLHQVKYLHVLGYGKTGNEMEHLKSFIGGIESLELLRVEFAEGVVVDDGIMSQFLMDVMAFLGSKCKTEVLYFV